jgi:hypothetical protein
MRRVHFHVLAARFKAPARRFACLAHAREAHGAAALLPSRDGAHSTGRRWRGRRLVLVLTRGTGWTLRRAPAVASRRQPIELRTHHRIEFHYHLLPFRRSKGWYRRRRRLLRGRKNLLPSVISRASGTLPDPRRTLPRTIGASSTASRTRCAPRSLRRAAASFGAAAPRTPLASSSGRRAIRRRSSSREN